MASGRCPWLVASGGRAVPEKSCVFMASPDISLLSSWATHLNLDLQIISKPIARLDMKAGIPRYFYPSDSECVGLSDFGWLVPPPPLRVSQ